jgi:hypothetical protein
MAVRKEVPHGVLRGISGVGDAWCVSVGVRVGLGVGRAKVCQGDGDAGMDCVGNGK